MTDSPFGSVARARGLARELVNGDGYVSHVYTGQVDNNPSPHTLHFLGRARFSQDSHMFFSSSSLPENIEESRHTFTALRFLSDRRKPAPRVRSTDMALTDSFLGKPLLQSTPLFAPHVDALLPVRQSLQEQVQDIRSRSARKRYQRLLKSGVNWRASRRIDDFQFFYSEMYLPTVQNRFGVHGHVSQREEMEHAFTRGGTLLFACAEDGTVESAALLCAASQRPKLLHYWKTALAHCDSLTPVELSEAYSRVEMAVLQYAIGEAFEDIHFGVTRAVLTDGVLVHKRRLGCSIHHNTEYMDAEFQVAPDLRPRLFSTRPVLLWRGGRPHCWVGLDGELQTGESSTLLERLRSCSFPHLEGVTLFSRGVVSSRGLLLDVLAEAEKELACTIEWVDQTEVSAPEPT